MNEMTITFLFRCASIEVDFNIILADADPPSSQELTETLQESLQSDNNLVLDDNTVLPLDVDATVVQGMIKS